jgi:ABC-2 type transport system permease protein
MIGVTEIDPNTSLAVLTGTTAVVLSIDYVLFKRGYGLAE